MLGQAISQLTISGDARRVLVCHDAPAGRPDDPEPPDPGRPDATDYLPARTDDCCCG